MHTTQYEIYESARYGATVRIATVETLGQAEQLFTRWRGSNLVIISRGIAPQVKSWQDRAKAS